MRAFFEKILKNPVWPLFILALIVRLLYQVYYLSQFGLETGNDAGDYIQFAEFMKDQGFFVWDISQLNAHAGPGFPFIIYWDIIFFNGKLFPLTLGVGLLANALLVVIIYKISCFLMKNQMAALLAGVWAVFYIHYIRYTPFLNKENLVFFLFPLGVYSILKLGATSKVKYIFYFSVPYLFLIHTDERYFFYFPFFLGYLVWVNKNHLKNSLAITLIVLMGMTPWLYRNYIVYARPVILTERTAPFTDKLLGYEEPVNPHRETRKKDTYEKSSLPGYEAITDSILNGFEVSEKGYKHVGLLKDAIQEGVVPHSYSFSEKLTKEFMELMRPVKFEGTFVGYGYRYRPAWKFSSNLIYGLQYGSLLILMPFGFLAAFKSGHVKKAVCLIASIVLIHIILHILPGHALQRYRVPIDFIFIILGMIALVKGAEKLNNSKGHNNLMK